MIIYTEDNFYPPRHRSDILGRPITKRYYRGAWDLFKIYCDARQAQELEQFKAICTARRTRDFGLVLCLEVSGSLVKRAMKGLKDDVDAHKDEEVCRLLSETPIISMIPDSGRPINDRYYTN